MRVTDPAFALAAFFLVFLLAVALTLLSLERLRVAHPLEWKQLGRPSLSSIGPLPGKFNLFRYNWAGGYKQLEDRWLDKAFAALKVCDIAGGALLVWYAVQLLLS